MRRHLLVTSTAGALVAGAALLTAPASVAAPAFDHLDPGGQPRLAERVPVNVVFIGYQPADVRAAALQDALPTRYEPVVRSRLVYGIKEKLGITYRYDYDVRFAASSYENEFFSQLGRLARPAPLTELQTAYNDQANNVLTVTENNHIDAPSVERWLALNPPQGVDTRRNTVFFINWYGRSDFRFHVYTKTDEPDPDTGYNFGVQRASRKMIAWGGTTADDEETGLGSTRRVWFHDLSAGPEAWTFNWNVDDPDLDGNGVEDYRMPPIWEYADDGYRSADALTGDLAKITQYVALDLLFTSSPLYPAELPTAEPPRSIDLDGNTYEGWPGVDASRSFVKSGLLLSELRELRWRNQLSYDNQDLPFTGKAEECYLQFLLDVSCFPAQGLPGFANLFLFNNFNLERTQDDRGRVDYELPLFNYSLGPDQEPFLLGFADDNWKDGTQSFVFSFVSPGIVEAGYGLTTTMIHEVGHHVGLSHPHDGYDSESGVDFAPADEFFFAWAGDESNSMMSYVDLNWDFSQFDQDNMNRFLAAAYIEAANRLAEDVLDDNDSASALDELRRADRLVGAAEDAFASHSYRTSLTAAQSAYDEVAAGARQAGVDVTAATAAIAKVPAAAKRLPGNQPNELVDSLDPDGPRSQP